MGCRPFGAWTGMLDCAPEGRSCCALRRAAPQGAEPDVAGLDGCRQVAGGSWMPDQQVWLGRCSLEPCQAVGGVAGKFEIPEGFMRLTRD